MESKKIKQRNKQNQNRLIDTENNLVVARREEGRESAKQGEVELKGTNVQL